MNCLSRIKDSLKNVAVTLVLALGSAISSSALASDIEIQGFASLVAGAVVEGDRSVPLTANSDVNCPCVVTDWSNNGIYEGSSWTTKPDTKAGIQLPYKATDNLSFIAQAITRGVEPKPELSWAFLDYQLNDAWSVSLGRKRLPMYYYSEFQDVGFAYPWITPPGELYGWETTNYNGASVRYKGNINSVRVQASIFGGSEDVDKNPYFETWWPDQLDSEWRDILGAEAEFSRDWWTLRFVYVQSDVLVDYDPGIDRQDMQAFGVAFNGDFGDWFFLADAGLNTRDYVNLGYEVDAPAYSLGLGWRFAEKWTSMVNYAYYKEIAEVDSSVYQYFRYGNTSLILRYDLTESSDIKVQFDWHDDDSVDYSGDAQLLRISYDIVF